MKLSLTIIGFFFNIGLIWAQEIKPNTEAIAIHATYKTYKTKPTYTSMIVKNSNNKLDRQIPGLEADNLDFNLTDKNSFVNCFRNVFNSARLKQLLPEHGITMSLYINSSGKILEMSFLLNQQTLVTANEIENLENQIKQNVTFKLLPGVLKANKFYVVSINIKYQKVLEITQ